MLSDGCYSERAVPRVLGLTPVTGLVPPKEKFMEAAITPNEPRLEAHARSCRAKAGSREHLSPGTRSGALQPWQPEPGCGSKALTAFFIHFYCEFSSFP